MNLKEAIEWTEMLHPENKGVSPGSPAFSKLHYYVAPWNDGYIVHPDSHIKRHPDIEWVYNTKEKWAVQSKTKISCLN